MNEFEPASALYLITAPTAVAVPLAEMKKHLRVEADNDDDDEDIETYTEAVTQHLDGRDGILGRALCDQTWELRLSAFPCGPIRIPLPPLIEVLSIMYREENGVETEFDAENFHVTGVGDRGQIHLRDGKSWPVIGSGWPEPVIVQFRCGYIDGSVSPPAANVPKPIVAAIKMKTADLYKNRESIIVGESAIELPWAAKALLAPYIVYGA